ncbi:MAG: endonuclease domain-containing protein [Sphingobacteriaceae bacterium]|nr:endonuclease domain-containing protein [Sphingobacteriaceae bacterium]
MEKHSYYNKNLKTFARKNRNNSIKAEVFLWTYILRASLTGYKFRRQRPILNYIADFMCIELKLIIEVDGYTHLDESVKEKDRIKQKTLERNGFKVIRFTDGDILRSLGWVNDKIMGTIKELESNSSSPVTACAAPPLKRGMAP